MQFMHQPGRARLAQALATDGVDGVGCVDAVHVQASAGSGRGRGSYNTIDISAMLSLQPPHSTPDAAQGWGPSSSDAPLAPLAPLTPLARWTHTPEWPWTVDSGLDGRRPQWQVCL
jgi:hypothetical protein